MTPKSPRKRLSWWRWIKVPGIKDISSNIPWCVKIGWRKYMFDEERISRLDWPPFRELLWFARAELRAELAMLSVGCSMQLWGPLFKDILRIWWWSIKQSGGPFWVWGPLCDHAGLCPGSWPWFWEPSAPFLLEQGSDGWIGQRSGPRQSMRRAVCLGAEPTPCPFLCSCKPPPSSITQRSLALSPSPAHLSDNLPAGKDPERFQTAKCEWLVMFGVLSLCV